MNKHAKSKEASEFEAKSETLDYLYTEQLSELRDLILKNTEFDDIETCRKWLKVFNKTSDAEKLARNCLCTLMQQQIQENGCLSEPFINTDNCQKNLECVLKELDAAGDGNKTIKSHTINSEYNAQSGLNGFEVASECRENDLSVRTGQLQQQLHILRLQLTEKTIENIKLKEIAGKYCLEREHNEAFMDKVKRNILDGVRNKLLALEQTGIRSQIHIFSDIFRNYEKDEEFMEIIRRYDTDFHYILSNYFRREFEKRKNLIARHISRQYAKSKLKLREKYEKNLKLQTKLVKLSCFSTLRLICIESHREFEQLNMWDILQSLEKKYQNILNVSPNITYLGI